MTRASDLNTDAMLFGNRFVTQEVPTREFPETGMTALARDIEEACDTLAKKGGAHESERKKIVTGPGH